MRVVRIGVGIVAVTAGLAAGAGVAAAAEPVVQVDQGRLGVTLSHSETAALADGPVPAVISMVVPLNRMGAGLRPDTSIYKDDKGGVHASLRQVIAEAADHPDGNVAIFLDLPGSRSGRVLDIYQNWD
ncbi:hypothetical protein ACFXG4_13075 [Nocardia sp. NPDC059246]|uniref:hypothetical protein n=1 Tax=Nocardia sp. NPDC059246 TaxID=3346789 RepID=UPI00369B3A91